MNETTPRQPMEKQPAPSYSDHLALAGVGLIAYGLATAWPPLCHIWLGAVLIAAAAIRARNRAANAPSQA